MKTTLKNRIATLVIPATLLCGSVKAADDAPANDSSSQQAAQALPDGYQMPGAEDINHVRPEKEHAPIFPAATPNSSQRGSLFRQCCSRSPQSPLGLG